MATHYHILAWEIPWTEEPVGYSPLGCKESDRTEQLSTNLMFFLYSLVSYYFIFLSEFKLYTPICQVLIYMYKYIDFLHLPFVLFIVYSWPVSIYLFIYIVLITKVLISGWQSHLLLFFKQIFMDTLKFILKNEHVKYFVKISHF